MAPLHGTFPTPKVAVRPTRYLRAVLLPLAPVRPLPRLAQELPLALQRPRRLLLLSRVLLDAQQPGRRNSPALGRLLVRLGQPVATQRAMVVAAPGQLTPHGETMRSAIFLNARMEPRQPHQAALPARTPFLKMGALALSAALVKP